MTEEEWKWALEPMRRKMMREATQEERDGVDQYIDSIAEPCDDAISRQKAIDVIDALYLDGDSSASYRASSEGDALIGKYQAITALDDLPPITPQPKTGHWIIHPKGIYAHLVCDKCLSNAPYDCRTNYCPNCGRRMIEPTGK